MPTPEQEIEDDPVEMIQHLIDMRTADDNTGMCKAQLREALLKLIDERIAASQKGQKGVDW